MMWRSYIVFYCLIKSWFLAHPPVCVRLFCMSMPDQLHMYIYNSSKFISVHLVLFSCILQYTFLIYRMLWSPMKGEENVALHTQNVFGTTCTSTLNTLYITCVSHKYVYMFCLYRYKLPKFHGWCWSMYDK